MSKELVISSNPHETKVAVLEDDQLVEIYFQRANEYSLAGSIHKGRVTRVLPGMQSAFVDLGLERDTFLYVSDFFEENGDEYDRITEDKAPASRGRERVEPGRAQAAPPPPIEAAPEPEPEAAAERVAPAERAEETADARDRRGGRRSRRRRNRGRGFPESKYASDLGPGAAASGAVEESEEEPSAEEVILLPGESLAKYRRRQQESASSAEPDTPDTEDEAAEQGALEAAEIADLVEERVEAGLAAAEREAEAADRTGDAAGLAEEEPEPPAEETVAAAAAPEAGAEPEQEPASTEAVSESHEAPSAAIAEEESSSGADPVAASEAQEEAAEESAEGEERDDLDLDDMPEPELVVSGEAGGEQPATASVREQSGRYQHRASRRMRRKRGERGDRGEHRAAEQVVAPEPESRSVAKGERPPLPSISDLLREGQEIIVQIAKEPLGQKGARITSHIALPGRYVVFMPTLDHIGVSRKIASEEERMRLKRILQTHRAGITGGFIVRTAGEGRSEEEIAGDMAYLYNLWLDIRQKAEKKKAPALLHHDLDIVHRILRDQLSDMFKSIWVDNEDVYESILRFMQRFQPSMVGRVKMYTRPVPIFDAFNITQEIEKALRPKVWLKSGGYIVINQTEALVAIDVNTGKYVGKSNRLEDTITKTNTEAVREIVRQIRLRDLGGIIVIDFIDMDERKNRQKVMQALEEAMRADRAPYKILQFNDFGLVAITRKRVKQSLERSLCSPCPTCEGAGYVKSVTTVIGEILQEAVKIRPLVEGKNVELRVYPDVAKVLKSNDNNYLEEVEQILGRPVMVISDARLHPEKFDMAW